MCKEKVAQLRANQICPLRQEFFTSGTLGMNNQSVLQLFASCFVEHENGFHCCANLRNGMRIHLNRCAVDRFGKGTVTGEDRKQAVERGLKCWHSEAFEQARQYKRARLLV